MPRKEKPQKEPSSRKNSRKGFHYEGRGADRTLVIEQGLDYPLEYYPFPQFEGNIRIEGDIGRDPASKHRNIMRFPNSPGSKVTIKGGMARSTEVALYSISAAPPSMIEIHGPLAGMVSGGNRTIVKLYNDLLPEGRIDGFPVTVLGNVYGTVIGGQKISGNIERGAHFNNHHPESEVLVQGYIQGKALMQVKSFIGGAVKEGGEVEFWKDQGSVRLGDIETGAAVIHKGHGVVETGKIHKNSVIDAPLIDIIAADVDEEVLHQIVAKTVKSLKNGLTYVPGAKLQTQSGENLADVIVTVADTPPSEVTPDKKETSVSPPSGTITR